MRHKRETDLDIARGIIIVMVAFCHSINTDFESVDRWFQLTYLVLNMIMMPAFMFVSGIVLALSTKTVRDFKEYVSLSLKRTERLLVPYILFALTVFAGKLLLQHFSGLEKPVSADDFLSILIKPKASPFGSYLWFIYVLLQYYMIVPLLQRLFPRHWLRICLGLGVILLFVPGSDFLATKQFNEFFLFFVLGIAARKHYDIYLLGIEKYFLPATTVLVLGIALIITNYFPILLISLVSIPVLHQLARTEYVGTIGFFRLTGKHIYPIYLMNTMFINIFKIFYSQFFPMHGGSFILYVAGCVAVGTLGPVAAQRLVISHTPYLKTLIR